MTKVNRKQALKTIALSAGLMALPEMRSAGAVTSVPAQNKKNEVANSSRENDTDWKTAALMIVDMQNDFVRSGAPLEVPTALSTVPAQKALIQAFRKHNLPVVYTKFISHPHYYLLWEWSPQCQPPTKCSWKGHQRFYKDLGEPGLHRHH